MDLDEPHAAMKTLINHVVPAQQIAIKLAALLITENGLLYPGLEHVSQNQPHEPQHGIIEL